VALKPQALGIAALRIFPYLCTQKVQVFV